MKLVISIFRVLFKSALFMVGLMAVMVILGDPTEDMTLGYIMGAKMIAVAVLAVIYLIYRISNK